jgi:hypothetical protein
MRILEISFSMLCTAHGPANELAAVRDVESGETIVVKHPLSK